jgi:hypothetical protein
MWLLRVGLPHPAVRRFGDRGDFLMGTVTINRSTVGAAIGALAMGFSLVLPAADVRAAEISRAGAGPATAGAPVEMQWRRGGGPVMRGGPGWGGGWRGGGWRGGGWRGGGWHGGGWGAAPWVGAAAAGLIIGGAAAAAAAPGPYYYGGYGGYGGCWIERRWVQRWDGALVPRNVRVCN